MSSEAIPRPISKSLFTPGVFVLFAFAAVGGLLALYRFAFGLGPITNLDNYYPWGIWIGVDVASGVALAAGGFTTAFLAHIINRHKYEEITRPALLTAVLGYTFVAVGVFTDIGQYYDIWHLMLPKYWQPNSALFEVGVCVMMYVSVLWIEFAPMVVERFKGKVDLPGELFIFNNLAEKVLTLIELSLSKLMFLFILAGVVLSCAHQSSLGTLLTLAPTKVHPLWYSPFMPLMFLLSAFAVGYPMVVFESVWAHKSVGLKTNMNMLGDLARISPFLIGAYLIVKIWDMVHRGSYVYLDDNTIQSNLFILEMTVGVIIPFLMFSSKKVRQSEPLLFLAAMLFVIFGVLFNRVNTFVTSYDPPFADHFYVPHLFELLVTIGFISMIILLYRIFITIFPIIGHHDDHLLPVQK
jgi:Ni/Fe-hydrogenase subunit HybB-like protein